VIVGTLRKDVRNTLFQNIQIEGQGFSPGEVVDLIVEGRGINHTSQLEIPHFQVKEDGHFSNPESLQMDEPKMSWQVFVIHQHGVACTNFSTNPAGTPDPTPLTAAPDGPV
jgi:hypothetical protein